MLAPLTLAMWNSAARRRIVDINQLATTTLVRLGYGLSSISLMWEYVPYADGYELQRATNSGFTTGLTTLYDGDKAGVTEEFQSDFFLKFHDTGLSSNTTYYYRVRAKNSSNTGAWSATKSVATGSSNKTVTTTGPTLGVTASDGAVTIGGQPFHGGDTLAISNPESGYWQYAYFINLNGTPSEPITFRNQGQVTGPALSLLDCSYINADFDHESKTEACGLYIQGYGIGECVNIYGLSHHIKMGYVKTRGGGYFLRLKNEANTFAGQSPSCGIRYMHPSRLHNIEIHHWDCAECAQDGFYIGSSAPWGGRPFTCEGSQVDYRPSGLANIHVHHNTLASCGRTGMQLGGMDAGTNLIHDNNISNCGWEYAADQGAGIAIGGACNSLKVHNNTITETYREALYSYHFGMLDFYGNTTNTIGTIPVEPLRGRFWITIAKNGGQTFAFDWDQAGKKAIEPNGEFVYEWFNQVGNDLTLVVTRLGFDYSNTEVAMPTASGQTRAFVVKGEGGNLFPAGQRLIAVNNLNKAYKFICTVTDVTPLSGNTYEMTVESDSEINGSGTFRNWIFFRETTDPVTALAGIGQTAPGSHAGTTADPFVGLGSNQVLNPWQIGYLSHISIPGGNAVGAIMLNPFNSKPVDNYGSPAGLMRFRIRNNAFGSQAAASTKVISFLNSTNNYGTGNIICGNTYQSADDVTESHITKPGGGVVTYELNSSCALTGNLVEQNETFTISTGTAPGLLWLPDDYEENPSRQHPLIVFLHGAGQASGSRNNSLLKTESLPKIISDGDWNGIAQDPDSLVYHKFIVAAPQAPEWSFSGADLGAIIGYCRSNYNVDDNRIYVTGLSAGGSGAISVGSSANGRDYVAAIVPVAAADFSSPTQNTEFDHVMGNDIKMLAIVGNDDSWKTFCQQITDRYNDYDSPSPSRAARRILMPSPAGHNANTWNVCFGTSFDASDAGDGPYNVYEWMLKHHKNED